MKKRFFAAVLCAMLLMTLFPATSFAVNVSAVQLGMSGVGTDDIIYFGTYNSENVPWYVWNTSGLLVSRYLLGQSAFQDSSTKYYSGSTLQAAIETRYNAIFPAAAAGVPAERNAILPTDLPGDDMRGYPVTGAKLFPLSNDEARSVGWGAIKLQARYIDDKTNKSGSTWWLRTSYIDITAYTVVTDGRDGGELQTTLCGVRPAFNLDTSKVLFTSSAIDGKRSASTMGGVLTAVPVATPTGTSHHAPAIKLMEWKLTLLDNAVGSGRESFDVSTAAVSTTTQGGSVEIAYSGAKVQAAATAPEYLSAMLADSAGKVLYYGRLKNIASSTDASGTQSIAVPVGLAAGDYTLKIFNEQYNGDYKTDYASAMKDVTLTVTAPTPSATIGNATVSGTAGTAITPVDATITLTNEQFNALNTNADVSGWFTNLPAGLAAKIKTEVTANATTADVTFSGTPTEASTDSMMVTILAANLVGNADLAVTANAGACWNIAPAPVAFSSLTADGSATASTTALTLTFDQDIDGLAIDDITVTGATKGTLTKESATGVYTLTISSITVADNGMVNVEVAKTGFAFMPANRDVAVRKYTPPTTTDVAFSSLAANGSATASTTALTLTFNQDIAGLGTDDITVTGATKGTLTKASGTGVYTLAISSITVADKGTVNVAVAKTGFVFTPANRDVAVRNHAPVDPPASSNSISGVTAGQVYTQGDTVTFTAAGGGMSNTTPNDGDMRWQPTEWAVNPSGTWSDAPYSASFPTTGMSLGSHTLTVTFIKQQRIGGAWVNAVPAVTDQKSVSFTLVAGGVTPTADPPYIPQDRTITVVVGNTATMSITATSSTSCQWYKSTDGGRNFLPIPGATSASYTTSPVTMANDGYQYYCVVTGNGGSVRSPIFTLNVIGRPEVPDTGGSMPGLWIGLALMAGAVLTANTALHCRKRKTENR